ncbi:MAG TPA: MATE family efflux transporter [Chloroflexota bacterium]
MLATLKDVVALASPIVVTELGLVTLGVVDTLVVGRLGAEAIGAVGLGNILFITVAMFGMGLLLGLDTVVSQSYGAGRTDECDRWLAHGVLLSLMAAVPLTLVVRIGLWLLPSWNIEPRVLALMVPYLEISAWGLLPLLLFAAFRRYLQAIGVARPIAIVMVTANLVNLVVANALVFGWGFLPTLGTIGSAWATLLVRIGLTLALAVLVMRYAASGSRGLLAGLREFRSSRLRRLVTLGVPAALQATLEIGVFATATAIAGSLDAVSLASHQIVMNVSSMTWIVTLGIGSAGAVLVGQSLGRGDLERARQCGWTALSLGVAFMVCAATCLVVTRTYIVAAFTPQVSVVEVGATLLLVAAAFQLFDGLQAVATGALRGLGDTSTPMVTNLAAHWLLGLPLGYVLCSVVGLGVVGLWMGLSSGLVVVGLVLLYTWVYRIRRLAFRSADVGLLPAVRV